MPDGRSTRHKRKPLSEETKQRISKALQGHKITDETRQKISETVKTKVAGSKNPFFGKTHSPETREKIRQALQGRKLPESTRQKMSDACWLRGKICPWFEAWMTSGIRMWGKQVKLMFNNCCAECGTAENLRAHHIIPKAVDPTRKLDLNNGVCLCHEHHQTAHQLLCADSASYQIKMSKLLEKRCAFGLV